MKDDPLSRREQMVLWRRLCRFIFKYMPVLAAGVFATYSLLAVFGLGSEIAVRFLFGVGLTPWLVLICASFAMGFCWRHRVILLYDYVVSIVYLLDADGHAWVLVAAAVIGYILVANILIRITIRYYDKKHNRQSRCEVSTCSVFADGNGCL